MSERRSRTVSLPADIEKAVEDAVAAGEFASAEDAIASAVGEWKERRENWGYTIAELRAEIQKGIDSGPAEPGEPFLDTLLDRYRKFKGDAAAE